MSTRTKVVVAAVAFALFGFMLSPDAPLGAAVFGSPEASGTPPTGAQVGALVVVGLVEAAAFGVGGAFLLFGLPSVRRVVQPASYAVPVWLAVSWLLVSWVPHTALHRTAGHSLWKLVGIEYGFHVTLILGGAVIAKAFLAAARIRGDASGAGRAAGRGGVPDA